MKNQNQILKALTRADVLLQRLLAGVCIAIFTVITVIMALNIFIRFVPLMSMHWFDEIVELLFGALIFYGAAAVWVSHSHFSVGDWISKRLPSTAAQFVYRLVVELLSLAFAAVFFWYALQLTLNTEEQTTAFAMSRKWLYACMPISGAIMVIYSLKNMVVQLSQIGRPVPQAPQEAENLNH